MLITNRESNGRTETEGEQSPRGVWYSHMNVMRKWAGSFFSLKTTIVVFHNRFTFFATTFWVAKFDRYLKSRLGVRK